MARVAALTSAGGILALLDEPSAELKAFALKKLDSVVDDFWAEIADNVEKLEIIYEDPAFPERELAALVVSKVYYHLGAFDDSLTYALNAGAQFNIEGSSQYVHAIIGKAIEEYIKLRAADGATVPATLEAVVNRMFARTFALRKFKEVAGMALETRRYDILERAMGESGNAGALLAYCQDIATTLVGNRRLRNEVLAVLARMHASQAEPDYSRLCHCYIYLDDAPAVAALLASLIERKPALAIQQAFDLFESAPQRFLAIVRDALAATPSPVAAQVTQVLAGDTTLALYASFLRLQNHTDKAVLKTTKEAVLRSTLGHTATVIANSIMYAATTSDVFLRENNEWLVRATNWAKFNAVASLGVIHKGHSADAMTILSPYLPRDTAGGSMYEVGGGLYALGLINANHGAGVTDYLSTQLKKAGTEIAQHGGSLALGLAAMASGRADLCEQLQNILHTDSAVAGEAAGIAIGLIMLGTADDGVLAPMIQYARDTQHEKIIRGLAVGIALVLYGRREQADGFVAELLGDKDAILRMAACHTLALAYVASNDNDTIRKLLHIAVTDVSDDVRRSAVTALGFVFCRTPDQLPAVVALLCESFNAHVRYGACLALGIACASTGNLAAYALVEPLVQDSVSFVRQGALMALAMIMCAQPNGHPKSQSTRKLLATVIADKHEDVVTKFGAIYAQGIIEAAGRNATLGLLSAQGHVSLAAAAGLLVFTQHWFWFPLGHFLSLALHPAAVICVTPQLLVPKLEILSAAAPSVFAYPPEAEAPKEKAKSKVETAVLSTSSKTKAKKKKEDEKKATDVAPMETDEPQPPKEEPKGPEPDSVLLGNASRVLRAQLSKLSFPASSRFQPVRAGVLRCGIVVVADSVADSPVETVEGMGAPASATAAAAEPEIPPPAPFEFDESLDE